MRTLNLSDENYNMLKKLSEIRKAQDNCRIRTPVWVVQTKHYRVTHEDFGSDNKILVLREEFNIEYDDIDELKLQLKELYIEDNELDEAPEDFTTDLENVSDYFKSDLTEFCKKYFDTERGDIYPIEYYYKDVAYFLSIEEAKSYCEYQGHNLNEPRLYAKYSGYGNRGYLPQLLNMLEGLEFEE